MILDVVIIVTGEGNVLVSGNAFFDSELAEHILIKGLGYSGRGVLWVKIS